MEVKKYVLEILDVKMLLRLPVSLNPKLTTAVPTLYQASGHCFPHHVTERNFKKKKREIFKEAVEGTTKY